jgi:prepilin-type N-terminal cleavage/methylation domain-containing protein/prepilin-type processing-associated H-X9-DG protein
MRRAFTLIELLVVIAVIALLIGLLLPAIGRAREAGRAVVCMSNQRQLALSMFQYAGDHRVIPGAYWQGPINLDWCGKNNVRYTMAPQNYRHPLEASVLREYLQTVDKIMECPSAKRAANAIFDYTMLIRMAGAKTDLQWKATYQTQPQRGAASPRAHFVAMPVLLEEDETFYNRSYDDGSFAWSDQMTTRHGRGANVAYLDGSGGRFVPPSGGSPRAEEPADLTAVGIKVEAKNRLFDLHFSAANEWGWVNAPR